MFKKIIFLTALLLGVAATPSSATCRVPGSPATTGSQICDTTEAKGLFKDYVISKAGGFDTTYFSKASRDVYATRTGANAANLTGSYTVTGALTVASTATFQGLAKLGDVGGNTSLLITTTKSTFDRPSLFNDSATFTGVVKTGSTGTGNGIATLSATGSLGRAASIDGNYTYTGTAGFTGLVTASAGLDVGTGTDAVGRITKSSTNGLRIRGVTGSSSDVSIANAAGNSLFTNPTGTNTVLLGRSATGGASGGFIGLGIATATPINTGNMNILEMETEGSTQTTIVAHGSGFAQIVGYATGGTKAVPTATPDQTQMIGLVGRGHNEIPGDSGYTSTSGSYTIRANGILTSTSNSSYHAWRGTPASSVTSSEWMRLINSHLLLGTSTENGSLLQVAGTSSYSGKATFSDTVVALGIRSANYNAFGATAQFGGAIVIKGNGSLQGTTKIGDISGAASLEVSTSNSRFDRPARFVDSAVFAGVVRTGSTGSGVGIASLGATGVIGRATTFDGDYTFNNSVSAATGIFPAITWGTGDTPTWTYTGGGHVDASTTSITFAGITGPIVNPIGAPSWSAGTYAANKLVWNASGVVYAVSKTNGNAATPGASSDANWEIFASASDLVQGILDRTTPWP